MTSRANDNALELEEILRVLAGYGLVAITLTERDALRAGYRTVAELVEIIRPALRQEVLEAVATAIRRPCHKPLTIAAPDALTQRRAREFVERHSAKRRG